MSSLELLRLGKIVPSLPADPLPLVRPGAEGAEAVRDVEPLPTAGAEADRELQLRLFALGLIAEIKPAQAPDRPPFEPVPILGEPISRTVNAERW